MKKLEEKDIEKICSFVTMNVNSTKIKDTCAMLATFTRLGFATLVMIVISFSLMVYSVYSGSGSGMFVCGFAGFSFMYMFGKIEQDRFKVCQKLAEDIYRISVNSVIMYVEEDKNEVDCS